LGQLKRIFYVRKPHSYAYLNGTSKDGRERGERTQK
jgi:hypothetical protein